MKKKFLIIASLFCATWIVIILKLNQILMWSEIKDAASIKAEGQTDVEINYFKQYYRNTIAPEPENLNGHQGAPVIIDEKENEEKDLRYSFYKFNELASSRIPILREYPEKRRISCFTRKYDTDLPTASIIIIYHNEAMSTLIRTIHTAVSRAPFHLIKEVILVDDFSDYHKFPHLLEPLDHHFKEFKKVKIIRAPSRIGLTVARLLGAKNATGDVLIFLDSHCECSEGWIEPLLMDIKIKPYSAITPIIDVISFEDFSISKGIINTISVGTFTWKADFTWFLPKDQSSSDIFVKSPTMAGGLFAIGRKYFFDIGSYDELMTYWGGENIEISFRLWMCGGGIYSDPCSIVGHVFRKSSPHDMAKDSVFHNKLRAVEVWMDDYKKIVYSRIGIQGYKEAAGSLKDRFSLREQLRCKSFKWYLDNVSQNIHVPGNITYIKNEQTQLCFDSFGSSGNGKVYLFNCHNSGGNQAFEILEEEGVIIFEESCVDLSSGEIGSIPILYECHFQGGNQKWLFKDSLIQHAYHHVCLEAKSGYAFIFASKCDPKNPNQIWKFNFSS